MRGIIHACLVLGALLLGVLIGLPGAQTEGTVRVIWGQWQLSASTFVACLALGLAFLVGYLLVRFAVRLARVPDVVAHWRSGRRIRRSERALSAGFAALIEGKHEGASAQFERAARAPRLLLSQRAIAFAGGAFAASRLHDSAALRRHGGLFVDTLTAGQISTVGDLANVVVDVLDGDDHVAADALITFYLVHPRAHETGIVAAQLCAMLGRWEQLSELLSKLDETPVKRDILTRLHEQLAVWQLREAADVSTAQACWTRLAPEERANPRVLGAYVRAVMAASTSMEDDTACFLEAQLRAALEREWADELVDLYGRLPPCKGHDNARCLEGWIAQRPDDPVLLAAAGRFCTEVKLWGKARSFLRASASLYPCPQTYFELALLEKRLGETEEANRWMEQGMNESLNPSTHWSTPGSAAGTPQNMLALRREIAEPGL